MQIFFYCSSCHQKSTEPYCNSLPHSVGVRSYYLCTPRTPLAFVSQEYCLQSIDTCLQRMATTYLAKDCESGGWRIFSSYMVGLELSLGKATATCRRTVGASGPIIWNALPVELLVLEQVIRRNFSIESFRKKTLRLAC